MAEWTSPTGVHPKLTDILALNEASTVKGDSVLSDTLAFVESTKAGCACTGVDTVALIGTPAVQVNVQVH